MSKLTTEEEILLANLKFGEDSAVTQRQLSLITGYTTRRIREYVNSLRSKGHPVCSDTEKGYWLACEPSELLSTVKILVAHLKSLDSTIRALQSTDIKEYYKEHKNEH